jgi:transposase InsO family protein
VLSNFFAYVHTQFGHTIKSVQCDNGREFDNSAARAFFLAKGVVLRMSCPYTSQQNGKAERMIRTIAPPTMSLALCCFKPPCPLPIGLMRLLQPPTSSTVAPLRP